MTLGSPIEGPRPLVRRTSDADGAVDAEMLRKYGDPYASEMNLPLARDTTLELLPLDARL